MDSEKIVISLAEKFSNFRFDFEFFEFGGKLPLFFIKVEDETSLADEWENITDFIATNFQINIETEFEIWNIYLFFLTQKPIDKGLKYKIENDTWSSRKIVIESKKSQEEVIKEHLSNQDLSIKEQKTVVEMFKRDKIISKAMGDKIIRNERTKLEPATKVLDTIAKFIRGE